MQTQAGLSRLWLCRPPIIVCALDGCMTLWGQPAAYWAEGYSAVRESNPLAASLLTFHPLAFVASGIPYVLIVGGAIFMPPWRFSVVIAFVVTISHLVGVFAWTVALLGESSGLLALLAPALVALLLISWWECGRRLGTIPGKQQSCGPI